VLEKNPYRQTQGFACVGLARCVKAKAENAQRGKQPNADALFKEADQFYERVNAQFADVKWNANLTLSQVTAAEVYELRNLEVGHVAPEIDGEDLDGKRMKLSDYRGKVVVLDFWADWCGYCQAMYPQERELVKQNAGKPFALLGVNSDADRVQIRKVVAEQQLNWPSWWDGGDAKRGIGLKWNVKSFPTVLVLDAKGVIRYKGVRGKAIDDAVDVLLKELGEAGTTGK
jgi:thiol-disulfide isomerase/thioredoxin